MQKKWYTHQDLKKMQIEEMQMSFATFAFIFQLVDVLYSALLLQMK